MLWRCLHKFEGRLGAGGTTEEPRRWPQWSRVGGKRTLGGWFKQGTGLFFSLSNFEPQGGGEENILGMAQHDDKREDDAGHVSRKRDKIHRQKKKKREMIRQSNFEKPKGP